MFPDLSKKNTHQRDDFMDSKRNKKWRNNKKNFLNNSSIGI